MADENIIYEQNGYRSYLANDARKAVLEIISKYKLLKQRIRLDRFCDLGVFIEIVLGPEAEKEYTRLSNTHGGKGPSRIQTEVSGLFELVERNSALLDDNVQTTRGTFSQLRRDGLNPIDMKRMLLPLKEHITRNDLYLSDIKTMYSDDSELDWFPTVEMINNEDGYLPVCLTHSLQLADDKNRIYTNRPNGLSSGMTIAEATLQGLLELIERDAECIFVGNSLPMPVVEPLSIDSEIFQSIYKKAQKLNLEVIVKNITTDIGLPTFYTIFISERDKFPKVSWGIGTHIDKNIAISRSVTEACQDRAISLARKRDILKFDVNSVPDVHKWEAEMFYKLFLGKSNEMYTYIYNSKQNISFRDIHSENFVDINEAINFILASFRKVNISKLYRSVLTKYEIPTVRMCCPELEFMPKILYENNTLESERRLYAVPKKLGYIPNTDFSYKTGISNNFLI